MNYIISDRIKGVSGSMIRELFKLATDPMIIKFGGGNPSAESFPVKAIEEIASEGLLQHSTSMLQYGLSEGYTPLRETLKKQLSSKGIDFENNEILIVSGAQQAADLSAKVLLNEGDGLISEDPSFVGCLNTFRAYGANMLGVPVKEDGMDIDILEKTLKENKNVKLIYTIPSFQNPTGFTTSLEKRKQILSLAEKYNVMIFEDNPYGELRFKGQDVPTIKSMDKDGRVIYAGSFSKVMAPAFRVGFLVIPKPLMQKMTVAKQTTDVHTTVLFQYICNEFMTKYDYDGHISKIRELYKHKAELMVSSMEKYFHPDVKFSSPDGGLFVMAFLPVGMDSYPFVRQGIDNKVATVPGVAFAVDQSKTYNGFRMNYSSETDENIVKGVEILGKMTYDALKK